MYLKNKGFFLVIEGNEGSGKSTISKKLHDKLQENNKICLTREPGGVSTAEEIRDVILKDRNEQIEGLTEAYLFAAARKEHLQKKIKPALEKGSIVIMDRYYYSSLAYQGYGRELGFDLVKSINQPFMDKFKPDLTVFLNVSKENRLKRLDKREEKNRLDKEKENFYKKVERGYRKCEKIFDEFVYIDANRSIDEIVEEILRLMKFKIQKAS